MIEIPSANNLYTTKKDGNNTSVNYNADTADVSVNTDRSKTVEKVIRKKDCSFETIYLFAR